MSKSANVILGALLVLAGILIAAKSVTLHVGTMADPQSGFVPFCAGVAIAVLSVVLLFQSIRSGNSEEAESSGNILRPTIIVATMLVYVLFFEILGFIIVTVLLAASVLFLLETKWWTAVVLGLILAIGTYFLFNRVLGVPLPAGILAAL
jgi:putative tricarboxylic transport membrane protein